MTQGILTIAFVAALAFVIGYAVGKMPCWESWQGYVALFIVVPIAVAAGVAVSETIVDCAALGLGFTFARRPPH